MLANLQLSIQFNVHTHILSKLKKERQRGGNFLSDTIQEKHSQQTYRKALYRRSNE
jgi:hypothetical protein